MRIDRTQISRMGRPSLAFFFCWGSGFIVSHFWDFSRLRLPSFEPFVFLSNQMFFYPQTVLPPGLQFVDSQGVCHGEFATPPIAIILGLLFWAVTGAIFAWFTRALRLRFIVLLAFLTIIVAPLAVYSLLHIFSIEPEIIGP
jgi:hypothetical protein